MKILKQPSRWSFQQPLLNRVLRVHALVMLTRKMDDDFNVKSAKTAMEYYDAKTRSRLDPLNWRVKLIRKLGT